MSCAELKCVFQFSIPEFDHVCQLITEIYEKCKDNDDGEVRFFKNKIILD